MLSTATHKTSANHFFATVVESKERIPAFLDVVIWMLKRDLLIRLHLRIRIIAPEPLKKRARQQWEERVMRKRSRSRARSITRGSRGRAGSVSQADEKGAAGGGPALESVSESSPVEYWLSLSPKTARKQARGQPVMPKDEGDDDGERRPRAEAKQDELDEELLSSSADEAKWNEYYQNGGEDDVGSIISDPARATPLERFWLAGMSENKDPVVVRRFNR